MRPVKLLPAVESRCLACDMLLVVTRPLHWGCIRSGQAAAAGSSAAVPHPLPAPPLLPLLQPSPPLELPPPPPRASRSQRLTSATACMKPAAAGPTAAFGTSSCLWSAQGWSQLQTQGLSKAEQAQPGRQQARESAACSTCLCLLRQAATGQCVGGGAAAGRSSLLGGAHQRQRSIQAPSATM